MQLYVYLFGSLTFCPDSPSEFEFFLVVSKKVHDLPDRKVPSDDAFLPPDVELSYNFKEDRLALLAHSILQGHFGPQK